MKDLGLVEAIRAENKKEANGSETVRPMKITTPMCPSFRLVRVYRSSVSVRLRMCDRPVSLGYAPWAGFQARAILP
jgi:metal-sulfur cluster biosynthetic enzyme